MSTKDNSYDVIVIGAGAAGLMCAAQAGQRGKKVLLVEHTTKIGEKIRISGGGRCNFTNLHCQPGRFISQNPHFAKSALARYTQHDFIALVDRYGIKWHEKTLGQLFCDDKSQQIIAMMVAECDKGGVRIKTGCTIESVSRDTGGFTLKTSGGTLIAAALVIATGGPSIPKIGATSFAYEIARQFGLSLIPPKPALVPLTFTDEIKDLTRALSGVAVDPALATAEDGTSFREALLFTHRGLSGPVILQISSYWEEGESITINLLPDHDMLRVLKDARASQPKKKLHNILGEYLPQRLADMLTPKEARERNMADLGDDLLMTLATSLNQWRVKPNGTEGYRTAEVTKGGVDTAELSSKTFEAKNVPGLYFIGEAVDVTGWLGGYNFQWAWSSGWCCGQAV